MIEIIAVEFIDAHADRAGGDERIEIEFRLVEEAVHAGHRLMGVVAADDPGIGDRVIGFADFRQQQQLHVEEREGRQDHEIGALLPFLARRIDEGHAGGVFSRAVEIDLGHLAVVARGEVSLAHEHRQ